MYDILKNLLDTVEANRGISLRAEVASTSSETPRTFSMSTSDSDRYMALNDRERNKKNRRKKKQRTFLEFEANQCNENRIESEPYCSGANITEVGDSVNHNNEVCSVEKERSHEQKPRESCVCKRIRSDNKRGAHLSF